MILMAMGDNKPFYLGRIILQVSHIRDHKINSQHIIFREGQAAVHYNNTVLILKGSNVHTDLFQSTERYDTQFSFFFFFKK